MAYTPEYVASDAPNAVIDIVVTIIAFAATFGGLIALALLYKWFKKSGVKV